MRERAGIRTLPWDGDEVSFLFPTGFEASGLGVSGLEELVPCAEAVQRSSLRIASITTGQSHLICLFILHFVTVSVSRFTQATFKNWLSSFNTLNLIHLKQTRALTERTGRLYVDPPFSNLAAFKMDCSSRNSPSPQMFMLPTVEKHGCKMSSCDGVWEWPWNNRRGELEGTLVVF